MAETAFEAPLLDDSGAGSGPRKLRDLAISAALKLPFRLRRSAFYRLQRLIVGLLVRTEPQPVTLATAGPPYCRFPMWLEWRHRLDWMFGLFEPEVAAALRSKVRPGDCCLDVGAHAGYYTILMSRLAGNGGQIIAFEPFPANARVLEENVRMNGLENVAVERMALSDGEREGSLWYAPRDAGLNAVATLAATENDGRNTTIRVETRTLDRYVEERGITPRVIKIDVEGAEWAVLRGASRTISRWGPLVLIELHRGADASTVHSFFAQRNYRISRLGGRGVESFWLCESQLERAQRRNLSPNTAPTPSRDREIDEHAF